MKVFGGGQPLEAGRGFCTGVLRRLLPKAVWCHGKRGKTRKEEKKPKELGEVRRSTKEPEGATRLSPSLFSVPRPSFPSSFLSKASPNVGQHRMHKTKLLFFSFRLSIMLYPPFRPSYIQLSSPTGSIFYIESHRWHRAFVTDR